jgi:hypothetical protein
LANRRIGIAPKEREEKMRFKAAPAKKNDTQVAEDNHGMKRPRLTISGMMVVVASVALGIAAYVALDRWTAMPWAGPSRDMPLAFRIVDDATGKTYRGCQTAGSGDTIPISDVAAEVPSSGTSYLSPNSACRNGHG